MVNFIGILASIMFTFCSLPQAIKSIKNGHSDGISGLFICMWLIGEILMQFYVIGKHGMDYILLIQYWVNSVFCLVILKYKYYKRP